MSPSVLVAFATRYGSTEEIAEAIRAGLRESGCQADVRRFDQVATLAGYEAVVLGAPLQMNRWHKDALRFVRRHQETLAEKPSAVFAVGPVTAAEQDWLQAANQLDLELARLPGFRPLEKKIFGGRFDPERLTGVLRLLPGRSKLPRGDVVDLEAAASWGRSLPKKFGLAEC